MSKPMGSDLCVCGDYRSQHQDNGRCGVCASSRAPYDGCPEFRLYRPANETEQSHWDKYHDAERSEAAPEPNLEVACASCGFKFSLHMHTVCPGCFAFPKDKSCQE
jgi:hypothetical protein